jgi:hypothetical protein
MNAEQLDQAIRNAQLHPHQHIVDTDGLRDALNEFAQPVGLGNQWAITVDGIRYSVRYADGQYTARRPKPAKKSPWATVKYGTTPDGDFDEHGNLR